jgi:hypothetical protein
VPLQNNILQLIRMSEALMVVAGVTLCVSADSATVVRLVSGAGRNTMIPLSVFFPCLARLLASPELAIRHL